MNICAGACKHALRGRGGDVSGRSTPETLRTTYVAHGRGRKGGDGDLRVQVTG